MDIPRTFSSPAARLAAAQLGRLVQMAAKIRKLAGNSKLVAAAPVTSLAIHTAVHVGRATMFVSL